MVPNFRSKKDVVYDLLKENIIKGQYHPGSRLVIDELASTLGVSQIPIREAMRELEADGFVIIEPYVGATIANIDANLIFEVFALLESLEIISSRNAVHCMSDDELNKLAEIVNEMDAFVDDPDQWSQANKNLHLFICLCAQSQIVLKVIRNVLDHWDRLRLHYLNDVFGHRIKIAQQEHKRILEAFFARDPDDVERKIREHNRSALTSYIQHLQEAGQISADRAAC
jgi:DNA-binding GntR family transcriptional regulator